MTHKQDHDSRIKALGYQQISLWVPAEKVESVRQYVDKLKAPGGVPAGVDPTAWHMLDEYRNSTAKLRKGWTDQAKAIAANRLAPFTKAGQIEIVETTIVNNWTGVFVPKGFNGASRKPVQTRADRIGEIYADFAGQSDDSQAFCDSPRQIRPQVGEFIPRIAAKSHDD